LSCVGWNVPVQKLSVARVAVYIISFIGSRLENRAAPFSSNTGTFDGAKNLLSVCSFEIGLDRFQAVPREILFHGNKGLKVASFIGDSALASGGTG
jgi:hypothetical protein